MSLRTASMSPTIFSSIERCLSSPSSLGSAKLPCEPLEGGWGDELDGKGVEETIERESEREADEAATCAARRSLKSQARYDR